MIEGVSSNSVVNIVSYGSTRIFDVKNGIKSQMEKPNKSRNKSKTVEKDKSKHIIFLKQLETVKQTIKGKKVGSVQLDFF